MLKIENKKLSYQRKKLVIFIPSIEGGGVEKNLFLIANYLSKKNITLSIITANPEYKKKFNNTIKIISPDNKSRSSRYTKYFYCLILLFKFLLKNQTLVFSFQANVYAIIVCKLLGAKILIRSNSSPEGWSKNIIKLKLYTWIFKLADQIIVNSIDFKKQMKKKFGVSTVCIYNPLNVDEIITKSKEKCSFNFLKKTKKEKYLKLISIGRFVEQKDHMCLLKALNEIKNKISVRLLLIGQGIEQNKYLNYIKKNSLSGIVSILNFQTNPFKYIKHSDIFILTSKFEGLPNVLLEAMTLKKSIISTNCPTGPREILSNGKFGFLIQIGDYKKLAKIILNYKNNGSTNRLKISKGYQSLDRFNFVKNCQKYHKIVNNLLYA